MVLGIYGSGGAGRGLYEIILRDSTDIKWDEILFINDYEEEGEFYGTKRLHLTP